MALIISRNTGDEIVCGCSCADVYGDTLEIVTSGLVPCECIETNTPGVVSTLTLDSPINGSFTAQWNEGAGFYVASLGTAGSEEQTLTDYAEDDCPGTPVNVTSPELRIGLVCRLDLGYGIFDVIGQISALEVAFDVGAPNVGTCASIYGPGTQYRLISSGIITILSP